MQNTKIDNYINDYLSKIVGKDNLILVCKQILNQEPIEKLDKYSKELLALSLEKQIVMTIEMNRIDTHSTSYWNSLKVSVPLIYNDNNILSDYLNLYIVKKDQISTYNNDIINEINDYYNNLIETRKQNFVNKMFALPSGRRVSVNDYANAIQKCINDAKEKEYVLVETLKKAKYAYVAAGLAASVAASIISYNNIKDNQLGGVVSIESEKDDNYVNTNIDLKAGVAKDLDFKNTGTYNVQASEEKEELQKEVIEEKIFRGYDNPEISEVQSDQFKEYQQMIYEESKKYNIPFNVMMVILDNESDGRYHTNGVINNSNSNGTVDYGLFQINSVNFPEIEKELGYSKDELLNEPKKNIEASCYLVNKIIEKYGKQHEEDLNNKDYRFIFGVYNGGGDYRVIKSDRARKYAERAQEKIDNIFNLSDDELFDTIYSYIEDGEHAKTR